MPEFASRGVVVGALAFAAVTIVLSVSGIGVVPLMLYLLYAAAMLTALYLVVRWAVAAGVTDAARRGAVVGRGGAREVLDARYAGGEEYERVRRDLETS